MFALTLRLLGSLTILASAIATAQTTTAEQCRQQYANDRVGQLICARQAFDRPSVEAQAPSRPVSPLVSPLAHMSIIFGFYDRRFPGFNGEKEHLGVDFAAAAGTVVAAVCDGTVISNNAVQADVVSSVVMLEHECPSPLGRVFGYYGHVYSELLPGDTVAAGSSIGTVRDWGSNSHLHLGLSTRLHEEAWGVVPRGATLQALEAQGWLNPLNYFADIAKGQYRGATRNAARPVVRRAPARAIPPKIVNRATTGTTKRRR